jgi:hypothetical protein
VKAFFKNIFSKVFQKLKSKKVLVFSVISILIVAIFTPVIINSFKNNAKNKNNVIISIWHVTSYEGSSGAPTFLQKAGLTFNKSNANVYVLVKKISKQEFFETMKELTDNAGIEPKINLPDAISFDYNIGNTILPYLQKFETDFKVREDLKNAGFSGSDFKALPYAMSGYAILSKGDDVDLSNLNIFDGGSEDKKGKQTFAASMSPNDMPLLNLTNRNDVKTNNFSLLTDVNALSKFKTGQALNLIGKAKDVVNVKNTGSFPFSFAANETYTDMVNFLGIINKEKQQTIESFFEFLTCKDEQLKLTNYNLFNVINENFYSDETMKSLEISYNKPKRTLNAFLDLSKIEQIKSYLNLGNYNEINKYFV